jgi:hypothetical protein
VRRVDYLSLRTQIPVLIPGRSFTTGNEFDGAILTCSTCINYRQDIGRLTTLDSTC